MNTYKTVKFTKEKQKRKGAWLKCATCNKEFYCFPERFRRKSQPKYCSMKCYDKTGNKNPFHGEKHSIITKEKWVNNPNRNKFKKAENNPNFIRYGKQSGFEGITWSWWKKYLINKIGKCEQCGFSDKRILEIHHKNRNRKANGRNNLILLCPNCHALTHYLTRTGKYTHIK